MTRRHQALLGLLSIAGWIGCLTMSYLLFRFSQEEKRCPAPPPVPDWCVSASPAQAPPGSTAWYVLCEPASAAATVLLTTRDCSAWSETLRLDHAVH